MKTKQKIIVVMPAYNAEKTLEHVYKKIPRDWYNGIILVDDNSKDNTYKEAKRLGIESYRNKKNLGYGGNLKVCLTKAMGKKADIIIEMHPDNEYDPSAIIQAISKVKNGSDFVMGNRFDDLNLFKRNGMPIWKYIPNKILTALDNIVLGTRLSDLHQGFRVYSRQLLSRVNYLNNSNNYLFSFEIIAQAIFHGMIISQVPVKSHYAGKKKGASIKNSIIYALGTFKILLFFLFSKNGFYNKIFQKNRMYL